MRPISKSDWWKIHVDPMLLNDILWGSKALCDSWVTWFNRQQHQISQIGIIIAHIGGVATSQTGDLGTKIDTYNVKTKIEKRDVATMEFDRKQFSCALITNGPFGNPTVAICKIIFMVLHGVSKWKGRN